MPKIQTYVSNNVFEKINDVVTMRKQEGVTDVTLSNVSSMLLELGLRVYTLQRERSEGGFNQREYNKVMMSNMYKVSAMCTEIMRMSALSEESKQSGRFEIKEIENAVKLYTTQQLEVFFPSQENEESD